jgi:SAM-dependent methyltransferase
MSDILAAAEPVAALLTRLANDRALPSPPAALQYCGDGDFAAIGAEFLGHFIAHAGLRPDERVLEIGCGIGRMAVPLTQYLRGSGCYHGVDVVATGIDWCQRAVTQTYPNFQFQRLDFQHPIYNPTGARPMVGTALPFLDAQFDFIALVSVITHLSRVEVAYYAQEIARLLAPGGRCFVTAFLLNSPARAALRSGAGRLPFDPDAPGKLVYAHPAAPLAAVAFDEDTLLELFLRVGLRRLRPAVYGHWSGRPSPVFQDICVFERGGAP